MHLGALARFFRREIAAGADAAGIGEVLVQVVHELAHTAIPTAADRGEVDHAHVLDELAQPDAPGMRAHRHTELRRQEQHREVLIHATQPAGIDLAEGDRPGLEQLLEEDPVHAVLARGHTDAQRLHRAGHGAVGHRRARSVPRSTRA